MDDISIFNNNATIWIRKIPHRIYIWLAFIIIGLVSLILIAFLFSYDETKIFVGIIHQDNGNYHVSILVPETDVNNIINKKLIIDNKEEKYSITNISDDYYIDNNITYREVKIDTTINEKDIINNNIIELKFIVDQTTLYQQLKERIKKGMI